MGTRPINRTERLEAIERLLFRSETGLRAVEIARACGVDRRTVYRDLALLVENGVPLTQKDGRYCLDHEHYMAGVRLNLNEALALFLSARVFSHHINQQNPHLVTALRKLSMALPEPVASHVKFLITAMQNGPVDPGFVKVLQVVTYAWVERRKIQLWYASSSRRVSESPEFSIYFVEATPNGDVYMVGLDSVTQRIRSFMLQRVKRVKMLRTVYEIPMQFSPHQYLSSRWGLEEQRLKY